MKTAIKFFAVSAFAFGLAQATVNFPFPQNSDYGNGIEVSDKAAAANHLKTAFSYYYTTLYYENGNYACIRADPGDNQCFSEGVGYGMLMMVYFSDNTKSYQGEFDKIWALYKAAVDADGLMNWKIGNANPNTVWGEHAATDAEMDVAAALIMAAYQFGNDSYLNEAKDLLKKVKDKEFESNGLHKPGNNWNDKKNPSYVAPAYYRLFAAVDTDNATFWNTTAMNANYTLLEANSNAASTGLFDNWCNASGNGLDGYYGYDAARTPWRLAQDFYWFGESRAQTMLNKLGAWVSGNSASSIGGSISTSGSMGSDHNNTFVSTLMSSLVANSSYQAKLDEYWGESVSTTNSDANQKYFQKSMEILNGLLVSGNMPNLTVGTNNNGGSKVDPPPAALPRVLANGTYFSYANNTVNLKLQGVSNVELLNLQGQKVQTLWSGSSNESASLKLNAKPGLYLVRIQGTGIHETHKVVVK